MHSMRLVYPAVTYARLTTNSASDLLGTALENVLTALKGLALRIAARTTKAISYMNQ